MLPGDVAGSMTTLINERARTLGSRYRLAKLQYGELPSSGLISALSEAPREGRLALGLLIAEAAMREAVQAPSKSSLSGFLFRYGAHLKLSVSDSSLNATQRFAVALATELVFESLPTSTPAQRSEARAVRQRLACPSTSDRDWLTTIGVTKEAVGPFLSRIADYCNTLNPGNTRPPSNEKPAGDDVKEPPFSASDVNRAAPAWLSVEASPNADALVAATANWNLVESTDVIPSDLGKAWARFVDSDYESAHAELRGFAERLGRNWGPSNGVDALRSWNWIRLVTELASIEARRAADIRRSRVSAALFAVRCLPDDDELIDGLVHGALHDFATADLTSIRAFCAYTIRLVADLGHEVALGDLSNQEKAALRMLWRQQFDLDVDDVRSTASAVTAAVPRYKEAVQRLYVGARDSTSPAKTLRDARHLVSKFLDESELDLLSQAIESTSDADTGAATETVNHRDFEELIAGLMAVRESIATSGSSLMQDFVAPLVEISIERTSKASERLGDLSRPRVEIQLTSAKVPFSAAAGTQYQLRFIAQNTGNASAESIKVAVKQGDIGLDAQGFLESLGAGAAAEIVIDATATGTKVGAVTLTLETYWSDALLQQFSSAQQMSAEDQGPVSWTDDDVNPFSLGTISDPQRLVGRDEDLNTLDALIAGGASAYVTGHKRVGKTSLTRVLLKSLHKKRGWAGGVLALGRALVDGQTAGDLVSALLDEILSAGEDAYPAELKSLQAVAFDESGNFARAANRWIRTFSRAIPQDARVIIAIDDFDELPSHLVEGVQADALFLFLRSLVDEPWLNLIVVGSEVLPSIIQKQAHKLNQVVPVSVTNFASRESTAALVIAPTQDRLEWASEAIDRLHYLCGGNPYYETLVAQKLWQDMREQSRSIATSGDVDGAADAVAKAASESHFVHLWADSSSGLDHTTRAAVVASAILRSVARSGGALLVPAASDEVVLLANTWIQSATTEELKRAIGTLRTRGVLRTGTSEGSLLLSIPLVAIWLLNAGSAVLDGLYSTSKHATATERMITDSDLVALSRHLRYRGEHITEIRLKAWLGQFGDNYHQYLAYRMLRRMIMDGYFTSSKLQNTVLPRLATNVSSLGAYRHLVRDTNNQTLKNAYLVDHGVPGDSTQGTTSALAKSLRIKKANILAPEQLTARLRSADQGAVIFLLDDYSGTGTHLTKTLEKTLEILAELGPEWHESLQVVVGAGVVSDESDLPQPESVFSVERVTGMTLGERYRPFTAESGVFATDKERHDAEQMTRSIGNALLPNNPLGFGERALLTLFEFNCPNNVAPIFWRAGRVSGSAWVPLFERMV